MGDCPIPRHWRTKWQHIFDETNEPTGFTIILTFYDTLVKRSPTIKKRVIPAVSHDPPEFDKESKDVFLREAMEEAGEQISVQATGPGCHRRRPTLKDRETERWMAARMLAPSDSPISLHLGRQTH